MTSTLNIAPMESPLEKNVKEDILKFKKQKMIDVMNYNIRHLSENDSKFLSNLLKQYITIEHYDKYDNSDIIKILQLDNKKIIENFLIFEDTNKVDYPYGFNTLNNILNYWDSIHVKKISNNVITNISKEFNHFMYKIYMKSDDPKAKKTKFKTFNGFKIPEDIYPEIMKKVRERRPWSNKDLKLTFSKTISYMEDGKTSQAFSMFKQALHIMKAKMAKEIDFTLAMLHMALRGKVGDPASKTYLLRKLGVYSDLAEKIFDAQIIIVGLLITARFSKPIIKIVAAISFKIANVLKSIGSISIKLILNILKAAASAAQIIMRILPLSSKTEKRWSLKLRKFKAEITRKLKDLKNAELAAKQQNGELY